MRSTAAYARSRACAHESRSAVTARTRPPGGEGARQGAGGRARDLGPRGVAGRRGREEIEQVALEPRHDRLRLRIAEAAVELEDARPARGQHQAGIEGAD